MTDPETAPDQNQPRPAAGPSFGDLLRTNLRIVGVAFCLAIVCYGVWRGLRWLFPDIAWLQ